MEVPRPGVESKLQLLAYTTATAMQDPRLICNLHLSSWQLQILNPLRQATEILNPLILSPHGYQLGSSLLSHNRNSKSDHFYQTNKSRMHVIIARVTDKGIVKQCITDKHITNKLLEEKNETIKIQNKRKQERTEKGT